MEGLFEWEEKDTTGNNLPGNGTTTQYPSSASTATAATAATTATAVATVYPSARTTPSAAPPPAAAVVYTCGHNVLTPWLNIFSTVHKDIRLPTLSIILPVHDSNFPEGSTMVQVGTEGIFPTKVAALFHVENDPPAYLDINAIGVYQVNSPISSLPHLIFILSLTHVNLSHHLLHAPPHPSSYFFIICPRRWHCMETEPPVGSPPSFKVRHIYPLKTLSYTLAYAFTLSNQPPVGSLPSFKVHPPPLSSSHTPLSHIPS